MENLIAALFLAIIALFLIAVIIWILAKQPLRGGLRKRTAKYVKPVSAARRLLKTEGKDYLPSHRPKQWRHAMEDDQRISLTGYWLVRMTKQCYP